MEEGKRLKTPFIILKQNEYSLSPLKLIGCDGGFGTGVAFISATVHVEYAVLDKADEPIFPIYCFTEIFQLGCTILSDFIELGKKPKDENHRKLVETLLSFLQKTEGKSFRFSY